MSMCPRCQVNTLFRGEARGIQLRACGRCRGVWLDADPSARVFAALADAPAVEHAPQGALPCACCGRPMKTRTPAGAELEIDVCAEHGAWFDHEELERLVTLAAARRGVTITPARRDAAQAGPGGAAAVAGVAAAGAVTAVLTADLIVAREPARDSSIVDTSAGDVILVDPVIAAEVGELAVEGAAGLVESAGEALAQADGGGAVETAVEGASGLVEGAGEALSHVGEAAGAALEGAGELAGAAAEGASGALELLGSLLEFVGELFG